MQEMVYRRETDKSQFKWVERESIEPVDGLADGQM